MRTTLVVLAAAAIVAMSPVVARATVESIPLQTQPMILGSVVDMNSHLVTVRAADGEVIPLEFDSRTVMAPTIPSGTPVRVTFRLMDNGVHLAQRVTTLEKGSTDWDIYQDKLAMADDQTDIDNANASYDNDHDADDVDATTASDVQRDGDNDHDRDDMKNTNATTTTNDNTTGTSATTPNDQSNTMPSTASPLPLALSVGLMLLACAAGLSWWRRGRA